MGVLFPGTSEDDLERQLDELALLVDTAGADVVARVMQRRDAPDPATYLGSGKVKELREVCLALDSDTVVFEDSLSPAQQRNLEKILGRTAIDRTAVILTSSRRTHVPQRAKLRLNSRCCSIGSRVCAEPADHSPSRPAVSELGGPAKLNWKSIGVVSSSASITFVVNSSRSIAPARFSARDASEVATARSPSWATRTRASHRC